MKTIHFFYFSFLFLNFFNLQLSFAQNTFPDSGRVGIGIRTPQHKLDIVSDSFAVARLYRPGSAGSTIKFQNDHGARYTASHSITLTNGFESKPKSQQLFALRVR